MSRAPWSMRIGRAWGLLVLLLWVGQAAADEASDLQGHVGASLAGEGPYWVGQAVTVYLDLASTGFSFADQHFELPEVPGALLLQPESSAYKLSEQEGDTTWQILRYELMVVPQWPGGVSVPAIPVVFTTSAGYGKPERSFELATEPLTFDAGLPPGLEPGAPVVTTTRLEVSQKWQPVTGERKVGDAVTRTLTLTADKVPGMALPPLAVAEIQGVAVYPAQPRVEDKVDRGGFTGERVDSHTYVFELHGEVEIPGASVQWWHPERRRLQRVEIEPLTLDVLPNPAMAGAPAGSVDRLMGKPLVAAAALLVAVFLIFALYRFKARLRASWEMWQKRRHESEAAYFRRLLERLRANQPGPAYSALAAWVERRSLGAEPALCRTFRYAGASLDLIGELERLQDAVANPGIDWDGRRMERLMREFRGQLGQSQGGADATLPCLNPRSRKERMALG